MPTIGFLGLGVMGQAMAGRLVAAGHDVIVWNRSASVGDELVAAGARRAVSPSEALAADVSYSMLANDDATTAVLSAENLRAAVGRAHICMASLSPSAVRVLAARARDAGVHFASAPVTGRPSVAASGQLNILAAGSPQALSAAVEGFEAMGKRVWPLGEDPTRAVTVKIAVNYNIIHAIQAIGESIALVEANGVDPRDFAELLSGTLFGGIAYTGYSTKVANRSYQPAGFSMALGRKDLGLAIQVAGDAGFELPSAGVLRALFDEALGDPDLAADDWGALAEVTRRRVPRP